MSRKAVRLIVEGRVQGVWFRAHTEMKARDLDLVGWARNLPDGTVEIVAEGEHAAVDDLVEWAWQGSPLSRVGNVGVEERALDGELTTFEIRY